MTLSTPRTILLVEDLAVSRAWMTEALRQAGYVVRTAGSVAEGLAQFAAGPPPDLLLADFLLPDGSGVHLADRLRDEAPTLRVRYMTGLEDATELDGPRVLTKPFGVHELLTMVRRACAEAAG